MTESVPSAAAVEPGALTTPGEPAVVRSSLTLWQANLLVAMLGGFWGRQADGHPGPDLLGRGLVMLQALVNWERIKQKHAPKTRPVKEPRRKPG